jgi:hypothetical protein
MSKFRAFVAAVLVSVPVLSLDAAQVPVTQGAPSAVSNMRPTTADGGYCLWINLGSGWVYLCF